jgi:hypothetical protein
MSISQQNLPFGTESLQASHGGERAFEQIEQTGVTHEWFRDRHAIIEAMLATGKITTGDQIESPLDFCMHANPS